MLFIVSILAHYYVRFNDFIVTILCCFIAKKIAQHNSLNHAVQSLPYMVVFHSKLIFSAKIPVHFLRFCQIHHIFSAAIQSANIIGN